MAGTAGVLAASELADDEYLWSAISELGRQLAEADPDGETFTWLTRNRKAVTSAAANVEAAKAAEEQQAAQAERQLSIFDPGSTAMTTKPKPWWHELRLRDELVDTSGTIADIQMSLRAVAYASAGDYPLYHSVDYFGAITHPSPSLRRIGADIAVRLGGHGGQAAAARPVWRFDQGMGGGKSHALVALWHMATNPDRLRRNRHRSRDP